MQETKSFLLAKGFLGKKVRVVIDKPLGSKHPEYDFIYPINSGYIPGVLAPDGKELDVHCLKVDEPIKEMTGKCVAIVHRLDDDDDKLIVIPFELEISDDEIERAVEFQEKWFIHKLIRR